MPQVERIQREILSLSHEEFTNLRKWFAALEWRRWDHQIEYDSHAGKLDFLLEEAEVAKSQNGLRVPSPLHSLIGIAETKDPTASKRVKEICATELDSQAGWTYTG